MPTDGFGMLEDFAARRLALHRHVAELTANQTDLEIRTLTVTMRVRLLEAHEVDP